MIWFSNWWNNLHWQCIDIGYIGRVDVMVSLNQNMSPRGKLLMGKHRHKPHYWAFW